MSLLYDIKFAFMEKMMAKRRKEGFNYIEADLFEIPADASSLINNSWFFGGDTPDGCSFKMRLGTRNNAPAEVFLIWIGPDGRYLATDVQSYPMEQCPIKVKNIIPGRDWEAVFDGDVKDMNDGSSHHCHFELKFTARLPIVHPMYDGCTRGMSAAFARERWNKKFFNTLAGDTGVGEADRNIRQVHYEQTGHYDVVMTIDGGEPISLSMPGIRDRAFGKRDWNYMDCHVWFACVTARGEAMNLSIVSYPHAKRFYCGYTDIDSDRNSPLTDYKIISYDHFDGKGPDTFIVDCSFENGRCYRVVAERKYDLVTPFDGGNFYFHEAVGDLTFTEIAGLGSDPVPGAHTVKARGTIELGWNKDRSRWGTYEK